MQPVTNHEADGDDAAQYNCGKCHRAGDA